MEINWGSFPGLEVGGKIYLDFPLHRLPLEKRRKYKVGKKLKEYARKNMDVINAIVSHEDTTKLIEEGRNILHGIMEKQKKEISYVKLLFQKRTSY